MMIQLVLIVMAAWHGAELTVKVAEPVVLHGMEVNFDPIDPDAVVFRTGMTPPNLGD